MKATLTRHLHRDELELVALYEGNLKRSLARVAEARRAIRKLAQRARKRRDREKDDARSNGKSKAGSKSGEWRA